MSQVHSEEESERPKTRVGGVAIAAVLVGLCVVLPLLLFLALGVGATLLHGVGV